MLELIIGCLFLVLFVVGGGVYLADRPGWNRTLKRVSRISRASLEAKKSGAGAAIEPRRDSQKALKDEWEGEFTGKTVAPAAVPAKLNHVIVKHDFYMAIGGTTPWPRWRCKCGIGDSLPSGGGLESAINVAKRNGEEHVRIFNKLEHDEVAPGFKF